LRNILAMKKLLFKRLLVYIIAFFIILTGELAYSKAGKVNYITILYTNDTHGHLEPYIYKDGKNLVGGFARRAALIKTIESVNKNVLTLDAGDFAQGTIFFNFYNGIPDVNFMHEAGYDVGTLGNHEFDKGLSIVKQIIKEAKFPFVCANIKFTSDKDFQAMLKPYIIKDYDGFKVAVIGLITPELKILVNKLENVEILDPIEVTRNIVEKINSKADLIVVLSHEGLSEDIKLAQSVPELDVIVGGHSHTLLKQPEIYNEKSDKTLVVQNGEYGVYLGRLDIKIKDKKIQNYYYNLIPIDETVKEDITIKDKIANMAKNLEQYENQIIGEINFTIGEEEDKIRTSLLKTGGLVTESIRHKFPEVDVTLQNSGGIRLQKHIGPGQVSRADIINLFPFNNTIVTVELKGSDLKSVLETSSSKYPYENGGFLQSIGLEYTINLANPPQKLSDDGLSIIQEGQRVSDIKINGKPLEYDKYYKLAINDYMFNGGNGYVQFKNAININHTGAIVQELIVNFIKEKSPVSVEVRDKINFINISF